MKTALIVYCSPAGSTRHVAQVIGDRLEEEAVTVHRLDLAITKDPSRYVGLLKTAGADACLFVGSPVYRDMAIPPVMAFLEDLPEGIGCPAVPFITWGGASSGIALWQMGKALESKGCTLAGAAKVLGVHSMMWPSDNPVGQGHPDADDDRQIGRLIDRLTKTPADTLSFEVLDYQPAAVGAEGKKKLEQPWTIIPKTVDEEKCTQCAICKQVCPVGAVTLDPGPVFSDRCFDCFNCVRECPEDAIVPAVPLEKIDANIRKRVAKFDERPYTQIF
ncbi:(Fe-S)-binding protein [Desulfosarcina alkanivorans]|uniref:(Fe-S)-binding protein n=1 Tax=Desulfosarcina alkanivorans TaxID=571177 RepID=A0A5K7YM76_9BACT|nr:EFR1 family ferrodoxin [Desulfosarcina alkanivorans]BBO69350.1 (Fe-S)-binding protein [Desulfosarcina alkanivorans]